MKRRLASAIRVSYLLSLKLFGRFDLLCRRVHVLEIGLTGYGPTSLDREIAKREGLRPLSRFERWVVKDVIRVVQTHHREAWKQSVKDVTGEDW